MRNAFAEALYQEALKDDRICVVVADISPVGSMASFREQFPDRFINVGVSEQAMIAVAAGLALKGKRPFCYTIANFALYRPFEFVRQLAYQNLPVTVVGMGAGLSYPDHGGTHHTIEDVAVASAIPNMTVLAPCDPFETGECVKWCAREAKGPVYLRLGKSGEPVLGVGAKEPWEFGKVRQITPARENRAILTYGPVAKLAVEAAEKLPATVFTCSTLKPTSKGIAEILNRVGVAVTIEEHVSRGGLSDLCERIAFRIGMKGRLYGFGIKDQFVHFNGKREDMLAQHGLTVESILARLRR